MKKIGDFVCKHKMSILIISILLLIPAIIGMKATKINYDILVYLPEDIETVKGQKILTNDFNMGAFSITIVDNMNPKDILKLEDKIKDIDGVAKVLSLTDVIGTSIPPEILPSEVIDKVKNGDSDLIFIVFEESTSSELTLDALRELRGITDNSTKFGGMSATVLDTMELSNKEVLTYVIIAVIFCVLVLTLSLDSYLIPFILLGNIGVAVLFNMGTNIFLGDISYITKAISSVLQLGVTIDFSIFLYHKYEQAKDKFNTKEEAMSKAINETLISVIGSSLTTIAGFLALCTMNLTLGTDIGLVMAKGVLIGVICVITLFPSLILYFDDLIDKTHHRIVLPEFKHVNNFVVKHYKLIFVLFIMLLFPAWYGNNNTEVYYNLSKTLPQDLPSSIANTELKEKFNIVSPTIVLIDKNIKPTIINEMLEKIETIDGIDFTLSFNKISELGIPKSMMSKDVVKFFENDEYQMILINSIYESATNELNNQISEITEIVKQYDERAIIAGEGPLMMDLVLISDQDFKNVNYTSIIVIFIIMIFVLKSISLPVILVLAIEFAIFVNMGIPYYSGTTIPFIASIVIGTIQLGATIDYAILMTTKYLEERKKGIDKKTAIKTTLDSSVSSIFVSGMCFFAATFGVGVYSELEMIGSLCFLISRGAIISMFVVIIVLPSLLLISDRVICKTTLGFKGDR